MSSNTGCLELDLEELPELELEASTYGRPPTGAESKLKPIN